MGTLRRRVQMQHLARFFRGCDFTPQLACDAHGAFDELRIADCEHAMAVEHSPENRRGFYGSWPQIGVPAGLLLASAMVYLLSFLPESDFFNWGWRIAFLISAILVAIGLYIRLKILETPAFTALQKMQKVVHVPFFELWRTHVWGVFFGARWRHLLTSKCCPPARWNQGCSARQNNSNAQAATRSRCNSTPRLNSPNEWLRARSWTF